MRIQRAKTKNPREKNTTDRKKKQDRQTGKKIHRAPSQTSPTESR